MLCYLSSEVAFPPQLLTLTGHNTTLSAVLQTKNLGVIFYEALPLEPSHTSKPSPPLANTCK